MDTHKTFTFTVIVTSQVPVDSAASEDEQFDQFSDGCSKVVRAVFAAIDKTGIAKAEDWEG